VISITNPIPHYIGSKSSGILVPSKSAKEMAYSALADFSLWQRGEMKWFVHEPILKGRDLKEVIRKGAFWTV